MVMMMLVVRTVDALQFVRHVCVEGEKLTLQLPIPCKNTLVVNQHSHNDAPNLMRTKIQEDQQVSSCIQFFQITGSSEAFRYGEALHPGPKLVVRTFNPAQLLGHEEEISRWPSGVWTAAETSHTTTAMQVTERRFRQHDVRSIFSHPVEKHSGNAGLYRGKAMGTAIMSKLYMTPYPMELDDVVRESCRFSDAIVHLGHGIRAYVCVVYGPPINNCTYADGEKVFLNAVLPGLQRATMFKGPAIISGDFNRDLGDCIFWESLRAKGWYDCAELAWQKFQKIPEPTCKDSSRRSFILINRAMAAFFQDCGTVEHHMFDAHPVLQAEFEVGECPCSKQVWSLPRSLDDVQFDRNELEIHANTACDARSDKFHSALRNEDAQEALRQFALAFEDTFRKSAVDVEGNHVQVPAACLKRCQAKVVKKKPLTAPVVRKGRNGDISVPFGQTSIGLKYRITQGRRLLSLCRQLKARQRSPSYENFMQCHMLWMAVCSASGFRGGFQQWILRELGWFVPQQLPDVFYVQELYNVYYENLQWEVRKEKYVQYQRYNKVSLEDLARGGGKAFKAVKEKSAPPPTFLTQELHQKLLWQRWNKQGTDKLRYQPPCVLEEGMPICFQGQQAILKKVDDQVLHLDRSVSCQSRQDMVVVQRKLEAQPEKMQEPSFGNFD